jgi:uncharacterized protein (DUF1778 family)
MARREESPEPARSVFTMRLGDDERLKLAAAAARRAEALSAYVRRVALQAARRDLTADR